MGQLDEFAKEQEAKFEKAWGDPLAKMMANKKECVPEDGFNLVGIDDFEPPGEQMEVIEHVATEEQAREAAKRFQKENPKSGVELVMYGPDGMGHKL